jgi:hypothetical protein
LSLHSLNGKTFWTMASWPVLANKLFGWVFNLI